MKIFCVRHWPQAPHHPNPALQPLKAKPGTISRDPDLKHTSNSNRSTAIGQRNVDEEKPLSCSLRCLFHGCHLLLQVFAVVQAVSEKLFPTQLAALSAIHGDS